MERQNTIELIGEIEKISDMGKCLTCQCFYDVLLEFKEVFKRERNTDAEKRLSRIFEKARVTHDCLVCEPCYPVPLSNALSQIIESPSVCSCRSTCKPVSISILKELGKSSSWPIEQGEYVVGSQTSPVAISTLGSDALPEEIVSVVGKGKFAIVGKTHTENIGIEKVIKNTITNPYIRFLLLCGKDTRGHMAGQSLLSLVNNGVDPEKKILGSRGQRSVLKNVDFSEIEHFRSQVEIIDLTGIEEVTEIGERMDDCTGKNRGKFDRLLAVKKVPQVEARQPERFVLDPSGFFIIYPKRDECRIYLEHYKKDGTLNEVVYGEDPVSIASTAIERGLVSRLDHAVYLGRELEKAHLSINYGFAYTQDSAPGKEEAEASEAKT